MREGMQQHAPPLPRMALATRHSFKMVEWRNTVCTFGADTAPYPERVQRTLFF